MAITFINPLMGSEMHYGIECKPTSGRQLEEMKQWCEAHVGMRGVNWCCLSNSKRPLEWPYAWYFVKQEDAILFQLAWQ